MDLTEHLTTIWRRKLQVVGGALLIAVIVYLLTGEQAKVFESQAVLQVSPAATDVSNGQSTAAMYLARTYSKLAKTKPLLEAAAQNSQLPINGTTADNRLTVTPDTDVGFLTVRATGPTAVSANRLADGEARAIVDAVAAQEQDRRDVQIKPLQTQLADVQSKLAAAVKGSTDETTLVEQYKALLTQKTALDGAPVNHLDIVQQADTRASAIAPTPSRNAILAFLVALVLNAELAVLLTALGDRLRVDDAEEVSRITDLPVLARMPEGDGPALIEAFRTLRTNLMFLDGSVQLRSLAVVGPEPESGKSFVAAGLAQAAASLGLPVVLVDGDLRHPVQHERLEVPSRPGLGDLLRRTAGLAQVLHKNADDPNLSVMPAGSPVEDPSGLLSGNMSQVLAELGWSDLVVVDTPAARIYAEGPAIAAQCDATLVVLSADNARRRAVREFVADLRRIGATPVGVVLNRVEVDAEALERYTRPNRGTNGPVRRRRPSVTR
jgi:capsular exopolysaccharide synthesis family protein